MSKIRLSHNRNNIVLIGHMGSGKTSIGMNLSKKIGFDFIDTDEAIENHSKITISEFFKKQDWIKEVSNQRRFLFFHRTNSQVHLNAIFVKRNLHQRNT